MPHIASNRFAGSTGENLYAYLKVAEENTHAARGGARRVLTGTPNGDVEMRMVHSPSPTLAALRNGMPVSVPGYKIPREWRGDIGPGDVVTVHPDGTMEKLR